MIKFIKYLGLTLLIIAAISIAYLYLTTPELPDGADKTIEKIINSEIPELVNGDSGYIVNDNIKIWYEFNETEYANKGTILLFMGISNDALGWPQAFLNKFVDEGYNTIRFDYRGTGLSDWVEDWKDNPYTLSDLATDARIILDSLNIDKVSLLGVSLGGMVAQDFAINYPFRTNALISVMSSGNILDSDLPPISKSVVFELVKSSVRYGIVPNEKNTIKLHLSSRKILQGNAHYDLDVEGVANQVLYNLRKRRGYNPDASGQHHEATYRSGSRYEKLKILDVPTLIIHGVDDPFIPIEHSKKLSTVVPYAKSKWINNMGHDIPNIFIDTIFREVDLLISGNEK